MSWDHAQKVIMEWENGEIRLKWKWKKGNRSKVTRLVTNACVMTSEECVNALYESDRKKGIGEVLKEAGPILKEIQRRLENGEKEWQQEQEALEKSAIKAAEKEHKDQFKQLATLTKKLESTKALHIKANSLRYNGVAMQTRAQNEHVYQETGDTIHQLEQEIRSQTAHAKEAEATHQELHQEIGGEALDKPSSN
jgi:valyl-tRNA synthetase